LLVFKNTKFALLCHVIFVVLKTFIYEIYRPFAAFRGFTQHFVADIRRAVLYIYCVGSVAFDGTRNLKIFANIKNAKAGRFSAFPTSLFSFGIS